MDYMFPSRTNENLSCLTSSDKLIIDHENLNLTQQDPHPPLFLPFPPPFLDDMVTHDAGTTIIATQNHPSKFKTATATTTERLDSKLKCVRRKRSAGKKDRHSKIHTAQGLRDRRMRLSVHTARKFFDLNDMLGFDKASKTIEWLFSKSKKAIDEVTENLQPDDHAAAATLTVISGENNDIESPLSATCETESVIEIVTSADQNDENLELHDDPIIENSSISKPMESYPLMVTELSVKEGRARVEIERTSRDRSILENNNNNNQHVEKLKQLFEAADDPRINNFHQSQLGYLEHHHNNVKESSSSSSSSGCYPLEFSNTYHFLKHLHLDSTTTHVRNTDDHTYNNLGNITSSSIPATNPSSIFDYNKTTHVITEPPAGWLNSKNTFLGFLGGWDSEINSRLMGSNNGGSTVPNINAPLIMMSRENKSSSSGIISSNYTNLHSENQGQ